MQKSNHDTQIPLQVPQSKFTSSSDGELSLKKKFQKVFLVSYPWDGFTNSQLQKFVFKKKVTVEFFDLTFNTQLFW